MTKITLFLAALLWSLTVKADTLTTASFVVDISRHCEEGNLTCDQVSDVGVSKKSGNRIALKGKSLRAMCADGVTPCRFLGYRFRNGNATYLVLEEGRLQVAVGGKGVLDESGEWKY